MSPRTIYAGICMYYHAKKLGLGGLNWQAILKKSMLSVFFYMKKIPGTNH